MDLGWAGVLSGAGHGLEATGALAQNAVQTYGVNSMLLDAKNKAEDERDKRHQETLQAISEGKIKSEQAMHKETMDQNVSLHGQTQNTALEIAKTKSAETLAESEKQRVHEQRMLEAQTARTKALLGRTHGEGGATGDDRVRKDLVALLKDNAFARSKLDPTDENYDAELADLKTEKAALWANLNRLGVETPPPPAVKTDVIKDDSFLSAAELDAAKKKNAAALSAPTVQPAPLRQPRAGIMDQNGRPQYRGY